MLADLNLGEWHRVVIHFPIALLIVAPLFDLLGFSERMRWGRHAGLVLLILGTAAALVAGLIAVPSPSEGVLRIRGAEDGFALHRALGIATMCAALGVLLLRLGVEWLRPESKPLRIGLLVLGIGLAVLVGFTGHYGGVLVFEHGLGTQTPPPARP